MGTRGIESFRGCAHNQSGQRFLDSSVPRLIRHASTETAGGGDHPSPAGKDEKLSREFEGGALIGRVATVPPSLDEVQINRDTPKGWKKSCGRFSVRGVALQGPGKSRFCRVGCKCWDCSGCGPRRASMYCIRIAQTAERLKLNKLLTLTLDPAKIPCAHCGCVLKAHEESACAEYKSDSTRYINEIFADFRVYLRRKLRRSPSYIRVLEYQTNGNAHLHILVNQYIPQAWVSDAWAAIGGGRIVDIRHIDMHRVSHYLSKYLTKDMIMLAPERARRVTTSRDIRLLEKQPAQYTWIMLRVPILLLFDRWRCKASAVKPDADGYLVSFEVLDSSESSPCDGGGE